MRKSCQKLYEEKEWVYFLLYMCKGKSICVKNTGEGYDEAKEIFENKSYFFIF